MLSYEAEREMMHQFRKKAKNTEEARKKRRGLLKFTFSKGQPSGMAALGILYPSRTLASRFDPLNLLSGTSASETNAIEAASLCVAELLAPVVATHHVESEAVDQRWYWAAPLTVRVARQIDH